MLNGPDYVLFRDKVAYQGFTVKGAIEYVRASRERLRLKQAALASKTIRDRFTEPAAMHRREKKFYEAGIARLERLYQKITGKSYPPPCPRPSWSPKSLDVIYLTTRYGSIKLAIESIRLDAGKTRGTAETSQDKRSTFPRYHGRSSSIG